MPKARHGGGNMCGSIAFNTCERTTHMPTLIGNDPNGGEMHRCTGLYGVAQFFVENQFVVKFCVELVVR